MAQTFLLVLLAGSLSGCETSREGVLVDVTAALRVYREQVDRKPSREQMEQLIQQLPAEQLADLGVMYEREQRLDDAMWAYQRAIWRDPRYARAYVNLGNVLRQQGKPDEAKFRYRQAMAADPGCVEAANNFADLCAADGTCLEEAINRLTPLVEKAGSLRPYVLDTLGWLYHQKGDHEQARQMLLPALRETPPDNRTLCKLVHQHLEIVCRALGLFQEAEEHKTEALRLGG